MSGWLGIFSLALNLVLGGTLIVTVATLKATVKKAEAEAEKAKAEVERMKTDNERNAMSTFQEFIVEPLKVEIKRLNRNVNGLQKAINKANSCPHFDDCPVLDELQKQSDDDCGGKKRIPNGNNAEGDAHG